MRNPFIRILLWLGIMALLTAVAVMVWMACGSSQTTEGLKWLQFMQTVGTFLLPPVLGACLWDAGHQPFAWLKMDRKTDGVTVLLALAIMVCAIPGINLLADLNSRVVLPDSLAFIERIMRQQEDAAAELTKRFLEADSIGVLLINIGLMALLPAMAEELTFRGTLQQILAGERKTTVSIHMAIWASAILFSAVHMQFYGFVPRMLMGAMFGYMFVWTGSLWVPILMHFTNNGIAVLAYYLADEEWDGKSYADTIGAGDQWWLGVLSIIAVCVLLWLCRNRQTKIERKQKRRSEDHLFVGET